MGELTPDRHHGLYLWIKQDSSAGGYLGRYIRKSKGSAIAGLQGREAWMTKATSDGGPLFRKHTSIVLPRDGSDEWHSIALEAKRRYVATQTRGVRGGGRAVFTAGPPGAGKSSILESQVHRGDYRHIDTDEARDHLLYVLQEYGYLQDLPYAPLGQVTPREMSGMLQNGANFIADEIRNECLETGENFIMEGTLYWDRIVTQTLTEFADAGEQYTSLLVIDVETSFPVARARSRKRWVHGLYTHKLGGRFINPNYLRGVCQADPVSQTQAHAIQLAEGAGSSGIPAEYRLFKNDVLAEKRTYG